MAQLEIDVSVDTINNRLTSVNKIIEQACSRVDRNPLDITLIAVTKNHSSKTVSNAVEAGLNNIGENRYQELHEKIKVLTDVKGVMWHYLGRIQRNKLARIAKAVQVIHSIDSKEQLDILSAIGKKPKLIVQISADGDPSRGGVIYEQAPELIAYADSLELSIEGVMMIPPLNQNPRPFYKKTADFARKYNLDIVSMGMSGDYEIAIECGSTHIRLGTSIFGDRTY